jgi:transcriptional antiterminator RfaH
VSESWYVVQSKPNEEVRAWVRIASQGFRTFYPQCRAEVHHGRKTAIELKPLYPSYLFVQFDVEDVNTWVPICSTRGVRTIIGMAYAVGRPLPLPDGVVDWLRGFVATVDDEFARGPAEPVKLAKKTKVTFTHGALHAQQVEALVDHDSGKRVRVLLDMLGKKTSMYVPRDSLAPKD